MVLLCYSCCKSFVVLPTGVLFTGVLFAGVIYRALVGSFPGNQPKESANNRTDQRYSEELLLPLSKMQERSTLLFLAVVIQFLSFFVDDSTLAEDFTTSCEHSAAAAESLQDAPKGQSFMGTKQGLQPQQKRL